MGDNNYPTYEQRELGPTEAERRRLQCLVEAGKLDQAEANRQYEQAKIDFCDFGKK